MKSLTKYLGGIGNPIVPPNPEPAGEYTLTQSAYTSAGIFKASDVAPKTLLRTLWVNTFQQAGTYIAYWDGLNDNGVDIISTLDYEVQLLVHNVTAEWQPIGNSSQTTHGLGVFHSYSRIYALASNGNNIYAGEGFNEAGDRIGFKMDRTSIQNNIPIQPTEIRHTNCTTIYVCANANRTFWTGSDPYPAYSAGSVNEHTTSGSWAWGTEAADDTTSVLSSGQSIKAGLGVIYPYAFDLVINAPTNVPTGMCCSDSYVWIAHGSINTIYAYNATTGVLLSTITGFTNPRELTYDSNRNRVYFLQSTNNVVLGNIGANGNLTSGSLNILNFPLNKVTLAIDNVHGVLVFIVGSTSQQVQAWNINASVPSAGALDPPLWTLGQSGGYQTTVNMQNDKFYFTDTVTNLSKPYVMFDDAANLYVGDVGNERTQIFDSSRVYSKTITFQLNLYSVSANMSDSERLFAYFMEFNVQPDGTWTQLNNYRGFITSNFYPANNFIATAFQWCWDYGGHTFATFDDYHNIYWFDTYIFEVSSAGLRNTGIKINENSNDSFHGYITKDGTIRHLYPNTDLSVGTGGVWKERTITGLDGSNNPMYTSPTAMASLTNIQAGDAVQDNYVSDAGMTDSVIVVKSDAITATANYHFEGYNKAGGNKVWSTGKRTNLASGQFLGYHGPFVTSQYFDIANFVQYAGAGAQVFDNIIANLYRGEFWSGSQTNVVNLLYQNGLPFIQFGTNLEQAKAFEFAAPLRAAGNCVSWRLFKGTGIDIDIYYLVHCDESIHSAIHRWKLSGIPDIVVRTLPIVPPTFPIIAGQDILRDLTYPSVVTTTGNISRNGTESDNLNIQCGVTSFDSYHPDIYLKQETAGLNVTQSVDFLINDPVYNPTMTTWTVYGKINFRFNSGEELTDDPTAMLQVLDDAGLVIAQISLAKMNESNYILRGNAATIVSYNDRNTSINIVSQWQDFSIVTTNTNCIINYAGYDAVVIGKVNGSAHALKPTKIRLKTTDLGWQERGRRIVAAMDLRYFDNG